MLPKRLILGISGGIAAYKCPDLVRRLVKKGVEVKVVMTAAAQQFVTPLTLQTVSNNPVLTDLFAPVKDWKPDHVALAQWADTLLIAPTTADIIGKCASGIADDALTTTFLAFDKQVFMAPAMNTNMYNHPIVQRNILTLKEFGVQFIEPTEGELACGVCGKGRMAEPEQLVEAIDNFWK